MKTYTFLPLLIFLNVCTQSPTLLSPDFQESKCCVDTLMKYLTSNPVVSSSTDLKVTGPDMLTWVIPANTTEYSRAYAGFFTPGGVRWCDPQGDEAQKQCWFDFRGDIKGWRPLYQGIQHWAVCFTIAFTESRAHPPKPEDFIPRGQVWCPTKDAKPTLKFRVMSKPSSYILWFSYTVNDSNLPDNEQKPDDKLRVL